MAAAALLSADPQAALAAGTLLVNEAFTGSTTSSSHWVLPSAPSGKNEACLTAGTSSSETPVPGCGLSIPDSSGSGALRFTTATTNQEGGVAYSLEVPTSYGVDATFDSYQYGGNGADGIGFFLAAADPSDPQPPASIGQPGGALGYSVRTGSPGLSYGYLGVGIDVYGNFANTTYEGSGCTDPGWGAATTFPNNVSVRGPGNGTVGYCMLTSTAGSGSTKTTHSWTLEGGPSGTRSNSEVPVEVVINPSASAVTSASGLSVPADDFEVAFTPLNNSNSQVVITGSLPTTSNGGIPSGLYPSGYIDPTTGIPYQLTFGWVASTGGSTDVHEVNNVQAGTLSGTPPQLGASVTDDASQAPLHGSTMDYDVTVSNASGAITEGDTVTLTDTVPAGETPLSSGLGGSGWSCSIAGQTVTCTEASPLSAGSSYPALTIPVTVTASGGAVISNTVIASSDDASAGSGNDTVTVAKIPTSITASALPSSATYGTSVTLSATGLPSAATGTVTFTSGATTLCFHAVSAGAGSCSAGIVAVGTYPVTASYSGDPNYLTSTAATSFTISQASTSFTASAAPSPTTYGTSVTLSATGLPSAATGTVTFTSGATTLCSQAVIAGAASCPTGTVALGTYPVTATYSGDSNFIGSTANTSFTVNQASTSFTASATPSSTTYGMSVTLKATGLPSAATGTVTFTSGATILCSDAVSSGDASCTTGILQAGTHPVTASFSGDTNYAGSTASTSFTINKAATSLLASAAPTTTTYGNPVTLSTSGLPAGATGTVTFTSGSTTLCSDAVSSGDASCTTGTLQAGTYPVTASYSGDTNYLGSTASTSFTIDQAPTSFTASAAPSTAPYGTSITLSAAGLPGGATGTVTFTSGATTLCSDAVSSGDASCTTGTVPVGSYPVTATYSGDADYAGATAAAAFTID
ncbi:MAG: Ig-like domain repeat protein, partial [Candidatus Dormiibacterota bacterium]